MTPIAVPIFVQSDPTPALVALRAAIAAGAAMIELRCDTATLPALENAVQACKNLLVNGVPISVIVTIRPTWEGGFYDGDEQTRISLFEHAGLAGADFIDVELVAWKSSANLRQKLMLVCQHPQGKNDGPRARRTKLILSSHDFTGRPADLNERLAALASEPAASILKLVWKAASIGDSVDALQMTRAHNARDPRPLLALAMGEFGQLSRLLGAKFGQPFTFATLPGDAGSAPGQPSMTDLVQTYRWHRQTADSPVFGVVGWPIGHTLSPAIHNAGFDALDLPGVYVPLPITPEYEAFAAAIDALRAAPGMNLRGLSITIPHKENALRYVLDRGGTIDELSQHIRAVNTIVWRPDNSIYGLNSDYSGALDALTAAMRIRREDLAKRRVAVIGAGGAARAIVAGLAACSATIVIYARRIEQARALAADFAGTSSQIVPVPLEKLCASCCEIYINCTPLGMYPNPDASPFDGGQQPFTPETVVFDTVYRPLKTKLLQQAEDSGARTVTGLEMFIRQAAVQFHHFTGRNAPVDVFRRAALAKLQ